MKIGSDTLTIAALPAPPQPSNTNLPITYFLLHQGEKVWISASVAALLRSLVAIAEEVLGEH